MPFTFLFIEERLARPSKEAMPNIVHLLLMAIDWICENLPRSTDSTTDLELGLLMSTRTIFQFAVPAMSIGNWKSLVKTLLSALTVITGFGLPSCQNWTLFSKPLETMVFIPGTKWRELMAAPCLPRSATCPLLTSQTFIEPSINPTQICVLVSFQVSLRAGIWNLQLSFWMIADPQGPWVTSNILSSPSHDVLAKTLGTEGAQAILEKESLKGVTD